MYTNGRRRVVARRLAQYGQYSTPNRICGLLRHFGSLLRRFGSLLRRFGSLLRRFGSLLSHFGDLLSRFGPTRKG